MGCRPPVIATVMNLQHTPLHKHPSIAWNLGTLSCSFGSALVPGCQSAQPEIHLLHLSHLWLCTGWLCGHTCHTQSTNPSSSFHPLSYVQIANWGTHQLAYASFLWLSSCWLPRSATSSSALITSSEQLCQSWIQQRSGRSWPPLNSSWSCCIHRRQW